MDPIDINALTDDELSQFAPTPTPQTAGVPQAGGGIDISQLTDADARALSDPMGSGEAAARLFGHHLSFGLADPLIGKESLEQARTEHPYIDVATGMAAMVPQTMALGPLAAAGKGYQVAANASRIAKLGEKVAHGVGRAADVFVPNMKARTWGQAGKTGAKVGAAYSGALAAGSGVTDPNQSWGDVGSDVAWATGVGAPAGFIAGATLHGVGRFAGNMLNRIVPNWREAWKRARAPGAQGIRDIERQAGYDKVDIDRLIDDLTPKPPQGSAIAPQQAADIGDRLAAGEAADAISAQLGVPRAVVDDIAAQMATIESKYGGLNLLEAAKMGNLRQNSRGEWLPEVRTTTNLDKLAQRAANIEGEGRNVAAGAFASRKQTLSEQTRADVDRAVGSNERGAADQFLTQQRGRLDKAYDKLRKKGKWVEVRNFGGVENVPEFQQALRYAGVSDLTRKAGTTEGPGLHIWKPFDGTAATEGQQFLSPTNLLDMHHALVIQAREAIGGDPVKAATANQLKNWFSKYVDDIFAKHKDLRTDYRAYKNVLEASERAAELGINTTNRKAQEAMQWFASQQTKLARDIGGLQKAVATRQQKLDDLVAKYPTPTSQQRGVITAATNRLKTAQDRLELNTMQFGAFRRAWGESVVNQIEKAADPNTAIRQLLTPQGQRRILTILGQDRGKEFIQALENKRMQTGWGNTLYGGPDTAFKLKGFEPSEALGRLVMSLVRVQPREALGATKDLASQAYRQRGADQVNQIFSQQGVGPVRNIARALQQQQSLRAVTNPYIRNPGLRAIGPIGETVTRSDEGLQGGTPYRRQFDDEGNPLPQRALGGSIRHQERSTDMHKQKNRGMGVSPRPRRQGGGLVEEEETFPELVARNPRGWGQSPPAPEEGYISADHDRDARRQQFVDTFEVNPDLPSGEFFGETMKNFAWDAAPELAFAAAPALGPAAKMAARGLSRAPVSSAVGAGGLGLAATAGSAGEGSDDVLTGLYAQRKSLDQRMQNLQSEIEGLAALPNKGEGVRQAQEQLMRMGYPVGEKGADGVMGPDTRAGITKLIQDKRRELEDLRGQISAFDTRITGAEEKEDPRFKIKVEEEKLASAERAKQAELDKPFAERHPMWATGLAIGAPVASALTARYGLGKIAGKGASLLDEVMAAREAGDTARLAEGVAQLGQWQKWAPAKQAATLGVTSTFPADVRTFGDVVDRYALPPSSKAQQAAEERFSDVPEYLVDAIPGLAQGAIASGLGAKFARSAPVGEARAMQGIYGGKSPKELNQYLGEAAEESASLQGSLSRFEQASKARELLKGGDYEAARRLNAETVAPPRALVPPGPETPRGLGEQPAAPRLPAPSKAPGTPPPSPKGSLGEAPTSAPSRKAAARPAPKSPRSPQAAPAAPKVPPLPSAATKTKASLPEAGKKASKAPVQRPGETAAEFKKRYDYWAEDASGRQRVKKGLPRDKREKMGINRPGSFGNEKAWKTKRAEAKKAEETQKPKVEKIAREKPPADVATDAKLRGILEKGIGNKNVQSALAAGDIDKAASILAEGSGVAAHKLAPLVSEWAKSGKFD